jgi:hypothetical protein
MKTTYPVAIYEVVLQSGLLSHAALCNAMQARGMDKASCIKLHLKRMLTNMGKLTKNGASYQLSEVAKSELPPSGLALYEQRLLDAVEWRANKEKEKQSGRLREEHRVMNAFKAAQKSGF